MNNRDREPDKPPDHAIFHSLAYPSCQETEAFLVMIFAKINNPSVIIIRPQLETVGIVGRHGSAP